eukprot:gnl/MRDRNA2_/MRDRNA2_84610_c0_seq1.p1 gnl/MRDRNA2_/MRDRNA2_84610_c0~~gnl/MRDRNA2_/MRDRNA2_84610_c0_seq1.p1  ORF type:complete len:255 (-),score=55.68 gnl/MRDRNA2_/MRDRNA2_84610_c0_seq1:611-1324(-)
MALALTEQKQNCFKDIVRHAVTGNVEAAGQAFFDIHDCQGLADKAIEKEKFIRVVGTLVRSAMITMQGWETLGFRSEEEYLNARLGVYFSMVSQLFADHRIRLDYDIWTLLTSFALIEGSLAELNGTTNILRCVLPYLLGPGQLFAGFRALWNSESATQAAGGEVKGEERAEKVPKQKQEESTIMGTSTSPGKGERKGQGKGKVKAQGETKQEEEEKTTSCTSAPVLWLSKKIIVCK